MIARNPRYKRLYLIMQGRYQFVEINEKTLAAERFVKLPQDVFEVYVSPDGKGLYLPAAFSGVIWKMDAESLKITKKYRAPIHCRRVALSRDGKYLFAASYLTGDFIVYDSKTAARLWSAYVSPKLESMYLTDNFVYLLGAEGLFRINFNDMLKQLKK